ncbi:histidinol-phosphatase [uncultured Ferrovibrio sp.]|jgi:inositol-phosphate phosphatase/L-galactose 1-phosphate phosphatase/histidinol-phosphatase|uniref:histidinol-phosphatase n=1 Tax=uncultured Ferrovibrio sp. TaxID=1576913 RepID=UPI0026107CB8|nr:histidinol-phosphatase [uncultured Ferrovibrio sp.]
MSDIPAFSMSADALVAFANRLGDLARDAIRPHFRKRIEIESKADASPVTIADRAAEAAMRQAIEAEYPDHGIYGEEYGHARPDAPWQWILDPIDGTKSFVTGLPIFGTLIALTYEGQPVLGVIDQPILSDRWLGALGRPTTYNGQPVRANTGTELSGAAVMTTYVDLFTDSESAAFNRLRKACRLNRMSGDCIAYAMIPAGFADIVLDGTVQPYDYAALIPVIEGAGGLITDWEGRALDTKSPARVLAAANPALHAAAREILSGA